MRNRNQWLPTVLVVLAALCLCARGARAVPGEGCVTAQCHPDMLKAKVVHPAAESCGDCHQAAVTPHPQKGQKTFQLAEEGAALCRMCHTAAPARKYVHDPVKNGECTSCHDPHGSGQAKLLVQPKESLCPSCHSEKTGMKYMHVPASRDCTSCHAPHDSDNKALVVKSGRELCFTCHGTIQDELKRKVVHEPAKEGCTPCHDPHGAPNARLLVKAFPAALYAPYTDNQYPLCFSCHNRDLLRFPTTSSATGFRDGERNLHFLHVNHKEKGRNCKTCHAMHASEHPKLIPERVIFVKWDFPMKYIKTETGGSCSPGCHKTFHYDRQTPGKAPSPEKPKGSAKPRSR